MKKDEKNKFGNCPCFDEFEDKRNSVKQGMQKCMHGAKWFLLVPGILIAIAFLIGYFLNPETLRLLWLVITGALFTLGISFYILMNLWISGQLKKSGI